MATSRTAKIFFLCWGIAGIFYAYGHASSQVPQQRGGGYVMATQSAGDQLPALQRACLQENVLRGVPLGRDGDAADIRETCVAERVLQLEKTGWRLGIRQTAIAAAAKAYAAQQVYTHMALLFLAIGLLPWLYGRGQAWSKPLIRATRAIWKILNRMA